MVHVRSEIVTSDIERIQERDEPRMEGILQNLDTHPPSTFFVDRLEESSLESSEQELFQFPQHTISGAIHESFSNQPSSLSWNAESSATDVSISLSYITQFLFVF